MGLLRRIPGATNPFEPVQPDEPPVASAPEVAVAVAPFTTASNPVSERALLDRIKGKIIADLDPAMDSSKTAEVRKWIRRLFDRLIESERITLAPSDQDRMYEWVVAELLGFGPIEAFVQDPTVSEILVIGPGRVYVRQDGRIASVDAKFDDEAHMRRLIDRFADPTGQRADDSSAVWQGTIGDRVRVGVTLPPVSLMGPVVAIQKDSSTRLSPEELLRLGTLSVEMNDLLRACVMARLNILVTGSPGAGKTSILDLLCSFMPQDDIDLVAHVGEPHVSVTAARVMALAAQRPTEDLQVEISPSDVLRHAVALRPDRIVLEQCSGPEALDMLMAMARGVRGWMTTVEGASPENGLRWLEYLASATDAHADPAQIRGFIRASIDVVVHVDRLSDGSRKVTSISDLDSSGDELTPTEIFAFEQQSTDGKLSGQFKAVGEGRALVHRIERAGIVVPASVFGSA